MACRAGKAALNRNQRAILLQHHKDCRLSRELATTIYVCDFGQRKHKPVELRTCFAHPGLLTPNTDVESPLFYDAMLLLGCFVAGAVSASRN